MIWSSSAKLRKFWQIIFEASKIIDPHVGTASKAKSPPVTQTVPDQESANLRLGEKDLLEVFGFNHPVASKRLSTRSRKNEKNVKVNHPNCNYKELDSEKNGTINHLSCFSASGRVPTSHSCSYPRPFQHRCGVVRKIETPPSQTYDLRNHRCSHFLIFFHIPVNFWPFLGNPSDTLVAHDRDGWSSWWLRSGKPNQIWCANWVYHGIIVSDTLWNLYMETKNSTWVSFQE